MRKALMLLCVVLCFIPVVAVNQAVATPTIPAIATTAFTPPLTDCYTSFNWESPCCADNANEIGRWTYCRCMAFGMSNDDCLREAIIAHNAALDNCVDQAEGCPPHEYWFQKP